MFKISKEFGFCYSHRVWVQELDEEYSLNAPCKCRHHHGHECKLLVYLEGEELNEQGMVVDFVNLNWLKKFLDDYLDHKYIIHKDDPLYNRIVGNDLELKPVLVPGSGLVAGMTVDLSLYTEGTPEFEHYESFFVVNFIPTSENLSRWAQQIADSKMSKIGVNVTQVDWWETPKSKATFYAK